MFYIQDKSIKNGFRYGRGLHVMLIDIDNVNQAKFHKWARHIFKKRLGTYGISNFSIGNGLRYARDLLVMF